MRCCILGRWLREPGDACSEEQSRTLLVSRGLPGSSDERPQGDAART